MEFTPRLKQILNILLKEEQPMPIKKLAEELGVSKRTVQREMEYINSSLKRYALQFYSKTGAGVWIEGSEEDKARLQDEMEQKGSGELFYKEERRKRLTLELLKDKEPKKLYYYSTLLDVSEATVSNDLAALEKWFEQFHLKISRKQGYGIGMTGEEKDYRRAIRVFLEENINDRLVREIYESQEETSDRISGREKGIYNLLDSDILRRVINCVLGLEDERIRSLTENSFAGLILHITIAINRILKSEIIETDEALIQKLQEDEEFRVAEIVTEELEEEFEIEIPRIETAYICLHIEASKSQYVKSGTTRGQGSFEQELKELAEKMIDAYDRDTAYYLKQDEEFVSGLLAHLRPTIIRLKNGMLIGNPLLEDIQKNYADIYEKCLSMKNVLEEHLMCAVPEEEVGFLAIHFGAAVARIENERETHRTVRLGIVCASGIGISRLMLAKISRKMKERVEITTYGREDITPYVEEKTDFFISTLPLEVEKADVLYVNPLLPEGDMAEIERRVHIYECTPDKKETTDEFSRQLEEVNFLAVQIRSLIKEFVYMKVADDISFDEMLVAISEHVTQYEDSRRTIQEDILRREKLATQIIPELGFSLLHTRTSGVLKPCFMVCVTKDKGAYTDAYFKGIKSVIVMLIPKDEHMQENSDILGYLSTCLIEEDEFLESIEGGTREDISKVLTKLLKRYFNQFLERV